MTGSDGTTSIALLGDVGLGDLPRFTYQIPSPAATSKPAPTPTAMPAMAPPPSPSPASPLFACAFAGAAEGAEADGAAGGADGGEFALKLDVGRAIVHPLVLQPPPSHPLAEPSQHGHSAS